MSLSPCVESFLSQNHTPFNLLEHPHSKTSLQTAHCAHVTSATLAKAVIVKHQDDFMMCVLPSSHVLVMNWLNHDYDGNYQLATENELTALFPDCESGAVPPLGQAYGMKVVWDNALRHAEEIYCEAGDHRHLINISRNEFLTLMEESDHATISCTPDAIKYYKQLLQ